MDFHVQAFSVLGTKATINLYDRCAFQALTCIFQGTERGFSFRLQTVNGGSWGMWSECLNEDYYCEYFARLAGNDPSVSEYPLSERAMESIVALASPLPYQEFLGLMAVFMHLSEVCGNGKFDNGTLGVLFRYKNLATAIKTKYPNVDGSVETWNCLQNDLDALRVILKGP